MLKTIFKKKLFNFLFETSLKKFVKVFLTKKEQYTIKISFKKKS
jgi:hypothetical protein